MENGTNFAVLNNTKSYYIDLTDQDGNILIAHGTTVPTDATAGFAKGCIFTDTNAAAGAIIFVNEGTTTSCAFKSLATTTGLAFTGAVTVGDNIDADSLILKARLTTSTQAGAALSLGATYAFGEAVELRYSITSWDGIGSQFQAMYVRSESTVDGVATLRAAEFMSVPNASGVTNVEGLFSEVYIKGDTAETITGVYGLHGEISMDAGRATSITLTEAAAVLAKLLTGKVADYTKFHGIMLRAGDMDGGSRTFGSMLRLLDGNEAGTSAFTDVLYTDMAATNFLQVSANGKGGATVGAMVKSPETDAEAGYLTIKVGATSYQIPFYATA